MLQTNSLFPVCESLCVFRLPKLEKALSHWSQANSGMGELVSVQDTRLRESLVALGADELFLSCVRELVCLQVT